MANKHYGNFGDIWKHLALAEILRLETPSQYWESHAGSAAYDFTHSPERDHGASYFFGNAAGSSLLKSSQFYKRFHGRFNPGKEPGIYPGSPAVALEILSPGAERFVFCDIDSGSIESVEKAGHDLGIPSNKLKAEIGDGLLIIDKEASQNNIVDSSDVFALIDPYCIFDENSNGLNSLQLFWKLTTRGIKTMLWYSFNTECNYKAVWYGLRSSAKLAGAGRCTAGLMAGEVAVELTWHQGKADPALGIIGCGIICGNLGEKAKLECQKLGVELSLLYRGSSFGQNKPGDLLFRQVAF